MWRQVVILVALAGSTAFADEAFTFPELARDNSAQRIVSGWPAENGQIPHQLSLRMINAVGGVSSCGASLIHSEWALTAAHCTATRLSFVLRAGGANLTQPALIFETTTYHNHPGYNGNLPGVVQPNDIGVLKIPIHVEFSDLMKPIRLQRDEDRDKNYDAQRLTASGWGLTWTQGASTEHLNWVYLRGVSNDYCRVVYNFSPIIAPSTICTLGYSDTTQSTCQGDSGGPLTVVDEDGKLTLVGVTSFVSSLGCHADMPAGFVRPGYYHDWLTEVTGVNFDWDFEESSEEEEESSEESSEEATTGPTEGTTYETTQEPTEGPPAGPTEGSVEESNES